MQAYTDFLQSKIHTGAEHGFAPLWELDDLFDFQRALVDWSLRKGRAAIFADCGMGKTPMQLAWAENVVRKTNGRVLIMTPLAVAQQTEREAAKFGITARVSKEGVLQNGTKIIITNYQRLHYFKPADFAGAVCDESGILKSFDGQTRKAITEFMRTLPYRLLCTATAAPNDYMELGTSSEALGELGFIDMMSRFFKKIDKSFTRRDELRAGKYRFRGHSEKHFWRWICSWARAVRKPSDMGFDDGRFLLPELITREHIVRARTRRDGWLFDVAAIGLWEQREERRRTINERCEMAAQLATAHSEPVVCWCHLNDEGDLLTRLIPDAVQVAGRDSDDSKEESLDAFQRGDIRVLVTKPSIAGHGLNWQHCAHQTFFPSHSFEQWYQAVRRSWRFGQTRPVTIDVIATEGERDVLANLQRKQDQADAMFEHLVSLMHNELQVHAAPYTGEKEEAPSWL